MATKLFALPLRRDGLAGRPDPDKRGRRRRVPVHFARLRRNHFVGPLRGGRVAVAEDDVQASGEDALRNGGVTVDW